MKCPQTKFHTHTMRESEVIRSKKSQNFLLGQNFLAAEFFLSLSILYWNYNNTNNSRSDKLVAFL